MNDIQRWAHIERLFKQMTELCDEIMRKCEQHPKTEGISSSPSEVSMSLTETQRERIIQWLESMPWWEELPYAQLEAENERLRALAHDYIQAYEKLAFGDEALGDE